MDFLSGFTVVCIGFLTNKIACKYGYTYFTVIITL